MAKRKRGRTPINEQFIAHRISMRESIAWRALPDEARRILDRLEVEHAHQAGAENGMLVQTYTQFHAAGIRRSSISQAIRQCETLGFLKAQKFGYATSNGLKPASRYCLTYVNGWGQSPAPTDDWKKIVTLEQAEAALKRAQRSPVKRQRIRSDHDWVSPENIEGRPARGSG